ncbi:hypothetical protein SLE2022_184360 [Rubroshorea leprosula]
MNLSVAATAMVQTGPNCVAPKNVACLDRLVNMGLMGQIDIDTLMTLPELCTLGFMNNGFNGSMPNIEKLSSLRVLYLSYNHFYGEIPKDAFSAVKALQRVYLQRN